MTASRTEVGRNGRQAAPPGHDFLNVGAHLSEEELAARDRVRSFVREKIKPNIKDRFDGAIFPKEIGPEFAGLGLLGMHLEGYGCAGTSAVAAVSRLATAAATSRAAGRAMGRCGSVGMASLLRRGHRYQRVAVARATPQA